MGHTRKIWLGTIGSENRIEATGIGNPIGAAIRLQHLSHEYQSQILITEYILNLISTFQTCLTREVDNIRLFEAYERIRIFEVFDADPFREFKQQLLDPFQKGLALFQRGRWEEAKPLFESCLQLYPGDTLTQLYLRRCHSCETDNKITVFLRNQCSLSPILRDADNIGQLARDFNLVTFQDGDCIMNIGESGLNFYLLFEGGAHVFFKQEDGTDLRVSTLKKGESFGEISLLTDNPVSATIISDGASQLLVMNHERFENMMRQYPQLNRYFHTQHSKYLTDLQSVLL